MNGQDRPPTRPRIRIALWGAVFVGFFGVLGVLSLADRAPDRVETGLRAGRDIGRRGERTFGFDLVDRSDIPLAWDTAGHIVLWFVAAVLATTAFGRRVPTWVIAAVLFIGSAAVEIAQGWLSFSREPSLSDLAANGAGVVAGVTIVVFASRLAHRFGRVRPSLRR